MYLFVSKHRNKLIKINDKVMKILTSNSLIKNLKSMAWCQEEFLNTKKEIIL